MLSRFGWSWSSVEVGTSLGRTYNLDDEAEMDLVPVRRGGSCDPILIALEKRCKVKVTGPPGCGKSSVYVAALARESRRPIVHLVPHPRLVEDFVARGYSGCNVMTDVGEVLRSPVLLKGPVIVVATYTDFLSRAMMLGRAVVDVSRKPIYYCDECHESDAATYSVVRMLKSAGNCHNAVFVSATLDGDEAALEPGSLIIDRPVELGHRSAEFTKVVVDSLRSNVNARIIMVFCDRGVYDLRGTEAAVVALGYSWFRLTSRASFEEFQSVKLATRTNKVVMCVDSSFRSGFDLPVAMVIDSGRISYRSSKDPTRFTVRRAFGFELYQARGRLGRNPLSYECDLVYVRPKGDVRDCIANIEGYEGVIAAHALHAQGLAVPEELRGIGVASDSGYLPDYRVLDSEVDVSKLKLASLADSKGKARAGTPGEEEQEYGDPLVGFAALNLSKPVVPMVPDSIGKTMISVAGAVQDISVGTQTFPLGRESVIQCLDRTGLSGMLTKIGRRDILLVCGVIAEEMNNLCCEYLAADSLIKYVLREPESDRSASQVRWLREFHSSLGLKAAEFKSRSRDLQVLVDNAHVDFALINPREFKDVITVLASTFVSVYKSQKNQWLGNDVIVDSSRQRVLGDAAINTGYDAAGRSLKAADPVKNHRLLSESVKQAKTSVGSLPTSSRQTQRFPDYSVKEVTLTVMHGSLESVQQKYPNAVITPDAMRVEYDSRSRRSSTIGSGSKGSMSERTYGKGLFKHTARTWHPPG